MFMGSKGAIMQLIRDSKPYPAKRRRVEPAILVVISERVIMYNEHSALAQLSKLLQITN